MIYLEKLDKLNVIMHMKTILLGSFMCSVHAKWFAWFSQASTFRIVLTSLMMPRMTQAYDCC